MKNKNYIPNENYALTNAGIFKSLSTFVATFTHIPEKEFTSENKKVIIIDNDSQEIL